MNKWKLDRFGTTEIFQRLIVLENKVDVLEKEREYLIGLIEQKMDNATDALEQKVLEKCYCRVYEKDFLVKLLEKAEEEE